jgi:hypothetical protein
MDAFIFWIVSLDMMTDKCFAVGDFGMKDSAPDSCGTSPYDVLDTDPQTATLSSFVGLNAGGFWTLYFADVSPLTVSTIQSWSINIITAPIPEPSAAALFGIAAIAGIWKRIRRPSVRLLS